MSKFDNAKVGDRVWYIIKGWGEVERVIKNVGIRVRFKVSETVEVSEVFTFDGKRYQLNDKYPMLFWNEVKLPTEEEDKKPFDLVKFLRENLTPKEFEKDDDNIYLHYNYIEKRIDWDCNEIIEMIGNIYFEDVEFEKLNILVNEMNSKGVTPEQLKQAYKELGWL